MSKKDRIAIVISFLYMLFPLYVVMVVSSGDKPIAIFLSLPVLVYWGYRFIIGDISFIKNNTEN